MESNRVVLFQPCNHRPCNANNGECPPECALAPVHKPNENARERNRVSPLIAEQERSLPGCAKPPLELEDGFPKSLKRKATLPPGPAQYHVRVHLLRGELVMRARGFLPRLKQPGQVQHVECQDRWQRQPNLKICHDDHGHFLRGAQHGGLAERPCAGGRRQRRDERELYHRRKASRQPAFASNRPDEHNVDGEAPAPAAPGGYHHQGEHLDAGHESYADAGRAGCLGRVGGDGPGDNPRRREQPQEKDGKHGGQQHHVEEPEYDGDCVQPMELVGQLVEHNGQDAGALRYEEPPRREGRECPPCRRESPGVFVMDRIPEVIHFWTVHVHFPQLNGLFCPLCELYMALGHKSAPPVSSVILTSTWQPCRLDQDSREYF
ncbi:hypothetical protein MHUMG1_02320 [Metarhizium humberi]|uniref:Uncharacterized protein n=1 Tax=Metarhizium humberi TaxID=2596975 RepID=A0A9P8MGP0_9HYPO|nr:hypothetical protein MHUMG1_02320 [Metarhizium humberi]